MGLGPPVADAEATILGQGLSQGFQLPKEEPQVLGLGRDSMWEPGSPEAVGGGLFGSDSAQCSPPWKYCGGQSRSGPCPPGWGGAVNRYSSRSDACREHWVAGKKEKRDDIGGVGGGVPLR